MASSIVSFLPSATEIIFALHLEDRLIGVSDLCDYPPQVRAQPLPAGSCAARCSARPEAEPGCAAAAAP